MKKTLTLLLFVLAFHPIHAASYTTIEEKNTLPVLTPCLKDRQTLKIRLDNGLEALIISDPNVDKSGAALSVNVGSWSDPEKYPGQAHFTEHMLFLGTKKYPEESGYHQYIKQHGGERNAYTTSDSTNYIFSINNDYFSEALDRFSQFFIEPLFNPSGVARELQAVDQEYAKNLQEDFIKQHSVHKDLGNPNHPFHNFSMGNKETLSSISQEELRQWYNEHYSANIMSLIVLSNLPLDQLKEMVVNDFSNIPNTNKTPLKLTSRTTDAKYDQHIAYIDPIKDVRKMAFVWELPPSIAEMREESPEKIVCFILGHEGEKSLLAQLKRENLAESLSCGIFYLGANQTFYYLEAGLTEKGLKHKDQVIERTFQALNQLREKEIPDTLFTDIQNIDKLNYQYQSCEDTFEYLTKMTHYLQHEKMETYPLINSVIQKFDPSSVSELLTYLTPERVRVEIITPLKNINIPLENTERWTQTHYTMRAIPNEKTAAWTQLAAHPNIDIPGKNAFIPENLDLYPVTETAEVHPPHIPQPNVILDSDKGKVYFAQDQHYRVPKVYWNIEVKTPLIESGSAVKTAMADLYIKMLTDQLNNISYEASLADLKFSIKRTDNGVGITIIGYHDKAETLAEEILKKLKSTSISEDKFKIYKDSLQKKYQNFANESSLSQALEVLKNALYQHYSTEKEKASAIKKVTMKKFNSFLDQLYQQAYVEAFLYGNMTKDQATTLTNKLISTLDASPYPKNKQIKTEVLVLPQSKGPFYIEKSTKARGNAVALVIEGDRFSFKERASQQIAMQALSVPFFSNLRTKQQTGYIVQSVDREVEKQLFDLFIVQSNSHDMRDLLARFEQFIEGEVQELTHNIPETQFQFYKQAALAELTQPPKSLQEMGELLTTLAFKYDGDFTWIAKRIQATADLGYDEFMEMTKNFLGRHNKKRLAILMKGTIPDGQLFSYTRLKNVNELKELSDYVALKAEHE